MKSIASSKASPALIEMSSTASIPLNNIPGPVGFKLTHESQDKFYNLTEPFLRSIIDENATEEFPFDLSPEELEIVKHFSTGKLDSGSKWYRKNYLPVV